MPKKIGIIGGLAFRAGVYYYDRILQQTDLGKRPLELVLNHADVQSVLSYIVAGNEAGLGTYLGTLANELADAGCGIVAVAAVAPHLAIRGIAKAARVRIANVLETIPGGLKAAGVERVAVFGNRAVMQTNVFGAVREDMVVQLDPASVDYVHSTYNEIALRGKRGTRPEVAGLSRLAHELIRSRGAQAILLAGTDLSSFYAEDQPDFPFVDVARLHIDQIMALAAE